MQKIYREAVRLLEEGEPFVLAAVAGTHGSTPQEAGAKLLIRKDGSILGTLGGGRVEAEACEEAMAALRRGKAVLRDFVLTEEFAADSGLACGGTMEIFVDPLGLRREALPAARSVLEALEGRGRLALVTHLVSGGTAAECVVREDGRVEGTLGQAQWDQAAGQLGRRVLAENRIARQPLPDGSALYGEAFEAPATLFLVGAGHVNRACGALAKFLGLRLVVVDDRSAFANRERFPDADEIIVADAEEALRVYPVHPNTFIVVATRGHKSDYEAARGAVRSPARYVGLLGSRRKTILIYRQLIEAGIPPERLREIRAPVGMNLGGRTPEEIAVSIMAEIILVRHGGTGQAMKLSEILLQRVTERAESQGTAEDNDLDG